MPRKSVKCQVPGCENSLANERAYYQRYRICVRHTRVPDIELEGVHSRWCQQCGRFQPLPDFDSNYRTCRARLARHNERRMQRMGAARAARAHSDHHNNSSSPNPSSSNGHHHNSPSDLIHPHMPGVMNPVELLHQHHRANAVMGLSAERMDNAFMQPVAKPFPNARPHSMNGTGTPTGSDSQGHPGSSSSNTPTHGNVMPHPKPVQYAVPPRPMARSDPGYPMSLHNYPTDLASTLAHVQPHWQAQQHNAMVPMDAFGSGRGTTSTTSSSEQHFRIMAQSLLNDNEGVGYSPQASQDASNEVPHQLAGETVIKTEGTPMTTGCGMTASSDLRNQPIKSAFGKASNSASPLPSPVSYNTNMPGLIDSTAMQGPFLDGSGAASTPRSMMLNEQPVPPGPYHSRLGIPPRAPLQSRQGSLPHQAFRMHNQMPQAGAPVQVLRSGSAPHFTMEGSWDALTGHRLPVPVVPRRTSMQHEELQMDKQGMRWHNAPQPYAANTMYQQQPQRQYHSMDGGWNTMAHTQKHYEGSWALERESVPLVKQQLSEHDFGIDDDTMLAMQYGSTRPQHLASCPTNLHPQQMHGGMDTQHDYSCQPVPGTTQLQPLANTNPYAGNSMLPTAQQSTTVHQYWDDQEHQLAGNNLAGLPYNQSDMGPLQGHGMLGQPTAEDLHNRVSKMPSCSELAQARVMQIRDALTSPSSATAEHANLDTMWNPCKVEPDTQDAHHQLLW